MGAVGYLKLVATQAPDCAAPEPGSTVVGRVVGSRGEPLLALSRDGQEAYTWLQPCGCLWDALAVLDALLRGAVVTAVSDHRALLLLRVQPWRAGGAAAAAVLAHLRCDWPSLAAEAVVGHPLAEPTSCGVPGCLLGCAAPDCDASAGLTATLSAALAGCRPSRVLVCAPLVPKLSEWRPNLGDLPAPALEIVVLFLDARSLRLLASTCRSLRQHCACFAPGLHLVLYPHQRDALAWMRGREAAPRRLEHPLWRQLAGDAEAGPTLWGHRLTGELSASPPPRGLDVRGGILADEPGLGKTVTVLALVLATRGTSSGVPQGAARGWDAEDGAAWYAAAGGADREEEEEGGGGAGAAAPQLSAVGGAHSHTSALPSPLQSPEPHAGRARRASAESLSRMGHFAALFSCDSSPSAKASRAEAQALTDARASASAARAAALSACAAPAEECCDVPEDHRIYLSKCTLVVCPPVLLAHWQAQLAPCVAAGRLRVAVAEGTAPLDDAASTCSWLPRLDALHPSVLAAAWDVLLVPITLLSAAHGGGGGVSPLLRVRWLRIVLDEGHALGASLQLTSRLTVACALRAERRWVVTGTPAPTAVLKPQGQLAHLRPLLAFLKDSGLAAQERVWAAAVQRPLEAPPTAGGPTWRERCAAADRLAQLLRRVCVRTRKKDIALQPLRRSAQLLRFNAAHAALYNDLVAHVRRGILLADWGDPNHEQSLLNPANAAQGRAAAENLREAACVAGRTMFIPTPGEVDRAMAALEAGLRAHGRDGAWLHARLSVCRTALSCARGRCEACARCVPVPLVTPCGHVVCCDCVGRGRADPRFASLDEEGHAAAVAAPQTGAEDDFERAPSGCVVCGAPFRMQAAHARADNPAPRQAVPQELIELQPGFEQSGWQVDWRVEAQGHSSKVSYLLGRLRELGAAPLDEPSDSQLSDARCAGLYPWPQPGEHRREARRGAPPVAEPVAPAPRPPPPCFAPLAAGQQPPKVIVYSAFATHLHVLDLALSGARVPFATLRRLGYGRKEKQAALASFRHDPLTRVLLLDRAGAEGLDLSFASHVVLAEPLPDLSLETQVISRAHRMGHTGEPVLVEVLAMEDTAEAALLELALALRAQEGQSGSAAATAGAGGAANAEALSRRKILTSLRFARLQGEDGPDAPPLFSQPDPDAPPLPVAACANGEAGAAGGQHAAQEQAEPGGGVGGGVREEVFEEGRDDGGGEGAPPPPPSPRRVHFADQPAADASWTLRMRGPQLPAAGIELELPAGGSTCVAELRIRAARAVGLDAATLRLRGGYPPRELPCDQAQAQALRVCDAGLADRDVLHVEGLLPSASTQPSAPAQPPSQPAAPPKRKAVGSRKFPGKARKTGAGTSPGAAPRDDAGASLAQLDAAAMVAAGPMAAASLAAGLAPDVSWLSGDGGGREAGLGAALLGASRGGGGGCGALASSLRAAMSSAVEQRAAEQQGSARVAAALAGAATFTDMADGRVHVSYSVPGRRGATATDAVADIPPALLPHVLRLVASDPQDAAARANLAPQHMAVASTRMFWAIVRSCGVGPHKSFEEALQQLVPEVDWAVLMRRDRQKPERYRASS